MDQTLTNILDEMKQEIGNWMDFINDKDADKIVKRTALQAGIHNYALLEYANGRVEVTDNALDFGMPEGGGRYGEELTEAEVRELVPGLAAYMTHKLESLAPSVIDYRFIFDGRFRTREGVMNTRILESVNEAKKAALLEQISVYIAKKLEAGQYPTKPLETFFLSRHLLDEGLYPVIDADRVLSVFANIEQLNKGSKHLAEHRRDIINALRNWTEACFLPRYFDITGSEYQKEYKKKSGARLENTEQGPVELLIHAAVLILRYDPSYSRSTGLSFLNFAMELGSKRAQQLTKEGSGSLPKEVTNLNSGQAVCTANDVFAEVNITIKEETEESYGTALRFLITLLNSGFPKSYQIKLKSAVKEWLPVKGLAKSGTHRFFANALNYPKLHPLLEQYARAAMEEFEWYSDTEGEKNCMPGSYAVFGLGLSDPAYFPLAEAYMAKVDTEHQSVQNSFTAAFAERYGVNTETLRALIKCMLASTDSLKLKIRAEAEEESNLRLLLQEARTLEYYEAEHIIHLIWGGVDKLEKIAGKARGDQGELLSGLIQSARRR
ncbi:hypothetical protein C2I18_03150 [Paenibacillus sp. PK3_47]|uniref:DUF6138 family protein n=1 Tax=Paenibacillus sp. PK3_47 TaxID=2072642 RepID=UPI00201D75DE|nr:DUF6138 family protein [Paenibacillus sp. PK3_47]UQZ32642.1 hypothetical protein C2I18_03150 [Paenibacillus sp. PK3_47]